MTENIIFYSALVFFTLIALGISWENRNKYILIKLAYLAIMPIVVLLGIYIKPELASFFDIKYSFGWPTSANNGYAGLKGAFVCSFYIAIITYQVALIHVLIVSKNRITSATTRKTYSLRS